MLTIVWRASLVASCIGLLTRPAVVVAFVTSLYVLGLPHNFGKVHHADALLVLVMAAFAFSKCGDAWSVDALFRRVIQRVSGQNGTSFSRRPAREEDPEYTWPLRLAWVLFCFVFFGAGVAKLRTSGLDWIFSDNMAVSLLRHHYTHHPLTDIGLALAEIAWIPPLIAAGTILFEISAPLALFNKLARAIVIPGLLLMQIGIWILLGVSFRMMFPAYLLWVPYSRLGKTAAEFGLAERLSTLRDRMSRGTR